MKSSPFDWDAIVIVNGEEVLLSELPGLSLFCTRCGRNVIKPKFVEHMVECHEWKVIEGVITNG